jgi:glutamate transport system permease protein
VSSQSQFLFDAPGPRGRRRIAAVTVISVLLLAFAGYQAFHQFDVNGQLDPAKWRIFTEWPVISYLLDGLLATLEATAVAAAFAMPLGALLALARLAPRNWVSRPAAVYTEVFRSVPVLLLIYICLLGLPRIGLTLPVFWQLVLPIVVGSSASVAEVFRAGVLALDPGQTEAARALGLGYGRTMQLVVMPQVVRSLLPVLVTQLVNILKDTTLGGTVSYLQLLEHASTLGEYTHTLVQTYLVVALIYVLANMGLSGLATLLDRRQRGRGPSRRALRLRRPGTAVSPQRAEVPVAVE